MCPKCGQSKRPQFAVCTDCYKQTRCKCCWKNEAVSDEEGFCEGCQENNPIKCVDCGVNFTTFHSTSLCVPCYRNRQQSDGYACKGGCGRMIFMHDMCKQCYQSRKNFECLQCQVAIAQPGYCTRCLALTHRE